MAIEGPYLLQRRPYSTGALTLSADQQRVVDHGLGRLRVLAGPGTGKTTTLVEAVARRIADGVEPSAVLVLTFSRRAAAELTDRITRRLGVTTREPIVRTLHAYAYALLRARALRTGEPAPRLLGAGESDLMVRELLAGHCESGGGHWPDDLAEAIGSVAFASELRDLVLRAAARGVTPAEITEMGRRRRRPEWIAAARFIREYHDVSDLRQGTNGLGAALDQAELTNAALHLLHEDQVLAAEQARIRRIFIDEYQDVDPAQARLIERLAGGADELVVAGDPDQSIYAFRGADAGALQRFSGDDTIALTTSRRLPASIVTATRRVAALLPGPRAQRDLVVVPEPPDVPSPSVGAPGLSVAVLSSASSEAGYVVDQLRRARLLEGVPYSRMAVLVRSPAAMLPALRRAFATADVPLLVGAGDQRLSADPLVEAFVAVIRSGLDPAQLTGGRAMDLLGSPLARLDALGRRRLRRALRAARPGQGSGADLAAAALLGAALPGALPDDLRRPVQQVAALIDTVRQAADDPSAEDALYRLWTLSRLENQLVAAAEQGGRSGQRADAALSAMVELCEMAADLTERLPGAGLPALLAVVDGQEIGAEPSSRAEPIREAVHLLSAHAAKGLEWDIVVIAGVQEGTWPDLRPRSSLLGTDEMFGLAAGLPPAAAGRSWAAERLADERRLFYVAATRARRRLIVTAVTGEERAPSRFLAELAGTDDIPVLDRTATARRLSLPDLVADLRRSLVEPHPPPGRRAAAAEQLARLAVARVAGADPDSWYGLAPISTMAPAGAPGGPVRISPSAVEALLSCGLRAVHERRGGRQSASEAQVIGTVVHALMHGLSNGLDRAALTQAAQAFLDTQEQLPRWQRLAVGRTIQAMVEAGVEWIAKLPADRQLVTSEVDVDALLPATDDDPDAAAIRLVGRVDRLDRRGDGALTVVDFKTGATKVSKEAALEHAQLAAYQSAIALGGYGPAAAPGGAELVYLRGGTAVERRQPALTAEAVHRWVTAIAQIAGHLTSPVIPAVQNAKCPRCPVRASCPAHSDGASVLR